MKSIISVRKIFLYLIFLYTIQQTYAQTWISVDGTSEGACYSIEVLESTLTTYRARINIHGLIDTQISQGNTLYHKLSFDNYCETGEVGEPNFPVITQLIAIPYGRETSVTVSEGEWVSKSIGIIYPSQEQMLETDTLISFIKSDSIYQSTSYLPPIINIGERMTWRDIDNISLRVCPFKYFPTVNQVSVLKSIIVEVQFSWPGETRDASVTTAASSLLRSNANWPNGFFDNSNILTDYAGVDAISPVYDILIIAGSISGVLHCQAVKDYMRWKAYKGFKSQIVSTLIIGTITTDIKSYIAQEYRKGVRYVLLIGDYNKVPTKTVAIGSEVTESDYWYGCMDGANDMLADLYVGRFSTNDTTELARMIAKTIKYESEPYPNAKNVLLVAHKLDAPNGYQGCSETIRNTTYQRNMLFQTAYGASVSNQGQNATNQDIITSINSGVNIVNYRGHGDNNKWADWNTLGQNFLSSQINNMNAQTNSIFFSIACKTGNIGWSNNMLEKFMCSDHGAVAFLGSRSDTFTDANHRLDKLLFRTLLDDGYDNYGVLNTIAQVRNICQDASFHAAFNAFSYICGGDPTLKIWTSVPRRFEHVSLTRSGNQIVIDGGDVNKFTASVISGDNQITQRIYTNTGSCQITKPSENCVITLNATGYLPYMITCDNATNYIQNTTFNQGAIFSQSPIYIGNHVTTTQPYGDVTVKKGNPLLIMSGSRVTINTGFKVEKGATLTIK